MRGKFIKFLRQSVIQFEVSVEPWSHLITMTVAYYSQKSIYILLTGHVVNGSVRALKWHLTTHLPGRRVETLGHEH